MAHVMAVHTSVELPGGILLDGFIQNLLQGIILAQYCNYWGVYVDDRLRLKAYVGVVVLLSILQTILQDYKVWRATIFHQTWSSSPIAWSDIFLNGVVCFLCQAFYIHRCWKFSRESRWVLGPLSFLSLSLFIANVYLAVSVQMAINSLALDDAPSRAARYLLPSTLIPYTYWIFGSLALDAAVASILIFYLWRSRAGTTQTDKVIWKVIAITWESAVPPALSMLAGVSLYHTSPREKDNLILFFSIIAGKLYVLGTLRTLNSRVYLRERMKSHDLGRTSLSDWQWGKAAITATGSITEPPRTPVSRPAEYFAPSAELIADTRTHDGNRASVLSSGIKDISPTTLFASPSMDARERGVSAGNSASEISK